MTRQRALVGALLILALYLLLAYGIYNSLTSRFLGANDFFSRWYGARALFLQGQDPYSLQVTQGIQMGMLRRLAAPGEDQVAFAYPLYVVFLVLPLVGLAYAQAQALWMAALLLSIVGAVLVILRFYRLRLPPRPLLVLLLGVLVFYPSARALFLGQFAIVSFLFLAITCWAILNQHDVAAGLFLALATVKPQTAALLVPCIIGWALLRRRWRLAASGIGSLGALTVLACLWLPSWPIEFLQALSNYTGYIRVGAPVQTVLSYLLPPELTGPGAILLGGILVVAASMEWLHTSDDILPAFNLTALITTWTAIRIGSSDQVLLLFPWMFWFAMAWRHGHRRHALLMGAALVIIPWVVFLTTLQGEAEDPIVTLVLPILSLVPYAAVRFVGANQALQRRQA